MTYRRLLERQPHRGPRECPRLLPCPALARGFLFPNSNRTPVLLYSQTRYTWTGVL